MPNFETNKQGFLTIPRSRFNLGDSVQWSLNVPGKDIIFYGFINVITWNHELGDSNGYWSYITTVQFFSKNGLVQEYHSNDDVSELDLIPWKGDGTDTKIDSGIDTKIGSGGSNMSSSGSKIDTKIMLQ